MVHHMRSCNGCGVCLRSKAAAKPHAQGTQAKELHDVVHMDICDIGMEVAGGYKYFLTSAVWRAPRSTQPSPIT